MGEKVEIFLPDMHSERAGDCSKGCSSFTEGNTPQWCGAVCEEGAAKSPVLGPGLPWWGAGSWACCCCDIPWGRLWCVPRGSMRRMRGKAGGFDGYEAHPVHLCL